MKDFLKKNKGNLLLLAVIIILIIPQTGMPIKVLLNRYIAFSPSEVPAEKQEILTDYDWPLKKMDGSVINFETSKNRVSVVNLWATWCPPCVAEMPSLQALYDAYGDRVDFYFVSSESPEVLERFMTKKGYDMPVYLQGFKELELLKSTSIPTTYILSKEGKIVVNKSGAARWDSQSVKGLLEDLLAE